MGGGGWGVQPRLRLPISRLLVRLIQLVVFLQGGRVSYLALLNPPPPPLLGSPWFEWRQTLDILRIKNKLSEIIEEDEE